MQASDNVFNFRKWMFIIGIILLALFALSGAFVLAMQSSWGRQKIVSMLAQALKDSGWSAEIEKTTGTLPHELVLHHVTITSSRGDVVAIQSIDTELSLLPLLNKEIVFTKFFAEGVVWTAGQKKTAPTAQKELNPSGIPWILHFSDIRLTHVLSPDWPQSIDLAGQIKIGRNNQMAFARISVQLSDFPESRASIGLRIRPNKLTQVKLDASTSSLADLSFLSWPFEAKGDIHLYAKGPWEAFSDLIFGGGTHDSIRGMIYGSLAISEIAALKPANHLLDGRWRFISAIERTPDQQIRFFNLNMTGDAILAKGNVVLLPDGQIKDSSLLLSIDDLKKARIPALEGSLTAEMTIPSWDRATMVIRSPHLKWDNQTASDLTLTMRSEKESKNWGANLDINATVWQHVWDAKCDLFWKIGQSLRIDDFSLTSPLATVEGNLEIFSSKLLSGAMRTQIANLHNFDIPVYGSLDTTIRLKIDETQSTARQMTEIDAKAIDFFYDGMQIEKAFFYADLNGNMTNPSGHAYIELQQAKWKSIYLETGAIETTSADGDWPVAIRAEGDWREPFELFINGLWHIDQSHFFLHLQDLTGSLFSRPISLSNHVELEWGPDTLKLDDFAILIGGASVRTSIDHQPNQTSAKLQLKRLPLDFLSLNPLNLSVSGLVNLDADVSEKKAATTGSISAELIDVEIASIGEARPIQAEGRLDIAYSQKRLTCDADLQVNQKPYFHLSADIPIDLGIYPIRSELFLYPSCSAQLTLNGQIEELLDFFNLGAHRIEGNCRVDLNLSGNLANPMIDGHFQMDNGRYENYYSGFQLQNISADIIGDRQLLRLRTLTAQDNQKKGRISLNGQIQTLWKEKFPFHFDGEFSRLNVAEMEWMRAEAGGTLQIFGDLDGAHVNGQAAILECDLSIPERIPPQLPNLQVKYINAPKPVAVEEADAQHPKSYPVFLDLHIYAPDGVYVSGRGLNSEWKGNFQLGGTFTDIEAKGRLELMQGEFLFSGRGFKLSEGSITFSGKPHEMPWINLAGEMKLRDLDILARLKGPLTSPQIAFQSIPPLPMGSILSQLLFGQDLSEINALQAAQIVNTLATFSPGSPNVFNNTRRSLGIDRLRIIATPTSNEGAQSLALQVGKYVTRGILVAVSQGFEAGSTNLSIEVDLMNGFVFQAESQQEQQQGKFTIKWNLNY
jgi:autotransporter translocation and assembly factor TamB